MIQSVAVVGRDIDAWLTALLLQNSLSKSDREIEIILVELPSHVTQQDVYSTLPSQKAVHGMMGLSESNLLSLCHGSISLGQRFSGWSKSTSEYMHVYDTAGIPFQDVDFIQYWTKARKSGLEVPLEEFSLAAASAKRGKIAMLNDDTEAFSNAEYGYNLSSIEYLKIIAASAIKSGIKHIPAEIDSVNVCGDDIESIALISGQNVKADIYIDASGEGAELLGRLAASGFESWEKYFPCDINVVAEGAKLSPVPSFNQNTAFFAGWLGIYPLSNGTALVVNCNSKYSKLDNLPEIIKGLSGIDMSQAAIKKKRTGIRQKGWVGNCIGVGATLATLDCIGSPQLHVLQVSLSYLLSLFPKDREMSLEADHYNKKMQSQIESIRDFQLAHYYLSDRPGEKFWEHSKDIEIPERLIYKINTFKARGVVPMYENETFQEESWRYIFTGAGIVPKAYDPLVDRMSESDQIENFQKMLNFLSREADQMPDLQTYIDMNSASESFSGSIF